MLSPSLPLTNFNPRLREEGDTPEMEDFVLEFDFNPRLQEGGDSGPLETAA